MTKPKLITVIIHKDAICEGLASGAFGLGDVVPLCTELVSEKVGAFVEALKSGQTSKSN